jgi:hypothetical protein
MQGDLNDIINDTIRCEDHLQIQLCRLFHIMIRTRPSNLSTAVSLVIALLWGYLVGYLILRNNRPNAWYDMDFSIWVVAALYTLVHLLVGKLWCIALSPLVEKVDKARGSELMQHWTESFQTIFASMWPVSGPLALLISLLAIQLGGHKSGQSQA